MNFRKHFTFINLSFLLFIFTFLNVSANADEMGAVDTSPARVAKINEFINGLKSQDSGIEEINVHATNIEGNTITIASTTPARIGKESDPEDIDAIIENKVVAIDEGGSVDVTIPMANSEGMPSAVAGITLSKKGQSKEAITKKALEIAKKIDQILIKK